MVAKPQSCCARMVLQVHFASPWSQCWRFCLQNLQHQTHFCSYFGKRGTKCNTIVVSLCFAKGANHGLRELCQQNAPMALRAIAQRAHVYTKCDCLFAFSAKQNLDFICISLFFYLKKQRNTRGCILHSKMLQLCCKCILLCKNTFLHSKVHSHHRCTTKNIGDVCN